MRELYALVFSVCVVLIGTEMIVRLFPEKSGSLIHALAALMLLVVLVNGILKLQSGVSLDFDLTETGEAESTITQSYAEKGTAILKERLSALLKSAGMDVPAENIDIWYTQDGDGGTCAGTGAVCDRHRPRGRAFAQRADRGHPGGCVRIGGEARRIN